MVMEIGVCTLNALKEDRLYTSVLSVQNNYSMPHGYKKCDPICFSCAISSIFKMDLLGKINKGPLLPVQLICLLSTD